MSVQPTLSPVRRLTFRLRLALLLSLGLALPRCSSCQLEDRTGEDIVTDDDDSGGGSNDDDDSSGSGNDDDSSGTGNDDDDDSTGGEKECEWWDIPCLLEQEGDDDDSTGTGNDDDSSGSADDDDSSGSANDDDDDSTSGEKECEWWDIPCLLEQEGDDDDSSGSGDDDDSSGSADDDDDSSGSGDDDDDDDSTGEGKKCTWPFDAEACTGGGDDDDDSSGSADDDDSSGSGNDDDSSGSGDDDDDDDDSTGGGKKCTWPFDAEACSGADDDDDDSTGTGNDDDDSSGSGDDDDDSSGSGDDDDDDSSGSANDDDDDDDSSGGTECGWPFDPEACEGTGDDDDDSTGTGADDDDDTTGTGEGECGDGALNEGEACDGPPAACTTDDGYDGFKYCNADCTGFSICDSSEFCGDGVINGEEVCDDGAVCDGGPMDGQDCTGDPNLCKPGGVCEATGSDECSEDCFDITLCGNGVVDIDRSEECDDGRENNASGIYNCAPDCRTKVPEKWISPTLGRITGALAVGADKAVYAGSEDGKIYALGASRDNPPTKTGVILWSHSTGAAILTHPTLGPPLDASSRTGTGTYNDWLYVGNNAGKIFRYGIKALPATGAYQAGTKLSELQAASIIRGGPAIGFNSFLYFAEGSTGRFSARNHAAATKRWFGYYYDHTSYSQPFGEAHWTANLGGVVTGEPGVGSDGSVYFIINIGNQSTLYSYWEGGRLPCSALDCNETHSEADHDDLDTGFTGAHEWKWWVYWNVPDDDCLSPCNSAMRNDGTNPSDAGPTWRKQYDDHGRNGKIKWERPVGGEIISGPVFDGEGRLYYGTADGDIVALNEIDGSTLWQYPLGTTCRPKQCEGDAICEGGVCREPCGNVCLNGSPCVAGVCSNLQACVPRPCANGGTCASDVCVGGTTEACGDLDCSVNTATPMVIDNHGIMYFGSADSVRAIRILDDDGNPVSAPEAVWTFGTDGVVSASPALGQNGDYPVLYVGTVTGNLYALDTQLLPEDDAGKGPDDPKFQIWRYRTSGKIISAPTIGRDGTIYLATNRVIALEGATNSDGVRTTRLCTGCLWPKFGRDEANSGRALAQVCGNGKKEGTENCDDGALNGTPDHCNTYCTGPLPAYCGNGEAEVKNPVSEYCDDGKFDNGSPNHCDFDCTRYTRPVCGNGVKEFCVDPKGCSTTDETCDMGVSGMLWDNPYTASADTSLSGPVNGGKQGNVPVTDYAKMKSDCQIQGSGFICYYVRDYDTCNSQTGNGRCLADCRSVQTCSNGTREGTEWCDDGSSNDTSNSCNRFCNDFVQQSCGNDTTESTGPKMNPCGGHPKQSAESCDDGDWNGWPFACDSGCGSYIWR